MPLVVAIATVPRYIRTFGEVRYGIWLVAWVVISYVGLADLGLGRATANAVAKMSDASARERTNVVWTGVSVNAAFGVAVAALAFGAAELGVRATGAGGRLHSELVAALPWLAAALPLFIIASVLMGALEGLEYFLTANLVGSIGTVIAQCLPLAAGIVIAPRLDVLAAATAVALALSTVAAAAACAFSLPVRTVPRFERTRAAALLRFGAWIAVTSLISPLLSTLDKLIIGAVSGARAVTHYTVPFNLVTRLWILPTALARSLFPRFSRFAGPTALSLADESSRALTALMTPIIVVGILAVGPFMRVWVGARFAADATLPAEILLLGLWANSLAFVPYTLLQAQGRPDIPAKFHVLELLPFLGVLWLGISVGGVAGAAAAWSLRVVIDSALLIVAAKFPMRRQRYLVPAAALAVVAFVLARMTPADIAVRGVLCVVLGGAAIAWSWWAAPPTLRRYALRPLATLRGVTAR